MSPIRFEGDPDIALGLVSQQLSKMPRVRIVSRTDRYLHATFTSRLFRFVDDVEFRVDESQGLLHFRSASRMGYSDLGVNRKRMQEFVMRLTEQEKFSIADGT